MSSSGDQDLPEYPGQNNTCFQRRAHMRTRVLGPVVLGIIVVALLLPPATAAASIDAAREQAVNGAFAVAINRDSITVVPIGQTCHIGLVATFTLVGGLDGAFTAPFA